MWLRMLSRIVAGSSWGAATCLVVAGCSEPPARVTPPPPKVIVQKPEARELVDYDQYNGWLASTETVEVRSRVRGHINKVLFTDGQIIPKGQLLFELDPRPLQSEIDRAQAQLRIAQAQIAKATKEEARTRELVSKNAASARELDIVVANLQSYQAQGDAEKQEIRRRELDLEYSRVTAPIAGRIGQAMLTEGNLVNAGGTDPVLATIVSIDPIYVMFNVDERSLQRYQKSHGKAQTRAASIKDLNIPVLFGLETDEGYPYSGVLNYADNQVNAGTGTVLVRGEVKNEGGAFRPGSRVRVRVPVSDGHQVSLVPDTAVLSDQDKKYLLVIDDKDVVQRRDVQLGKLLDDGMRVVLAPTGAAAAIGPNEWFIVQGLQSARLNYPVDPVRPASTQPTSVAASSN